MAEGDAPHKRALRRCLRQLIEDLNFESMMDYLISKEVFPMTTIRNMKDEKYSTEQTRVLIDNIEKAGLDVYKIFLDGLKATKQDHLRTMLLEEEDNIKSEKPQKKGKRPTEKSTESGESRGKMVELKAGTNETDTTMVRPAPTSVQEGKSDLEILADTTSHQKPSVGGDNVTDSCQPSAAVEIGTVIGKESPFKGPSDVPDGPAPVFDELRDPQVDNLEEVKTGSSDFDKNNLTVQTLTQTSDTDISSRDAIGESTEEPNNESEQISDGDSCKSNHSQVNLSSYTDLQEESNTEPIACSVKEQHYNQEAEKSRPFQPQSGNAQQHLNTVVPSRESSSRRIRGLNDNSTAMTQVGLEQGATPTIPLQPRTTANNQELLPIPAMPTEHKVPPSQPSTGTASDALPDQLAALDTSGEDMFFKELFDVCVIYTQEDRNRADEIVKSIQSLPESYKVCYHDDEKYFGVFPPESHPEVLNKHCFLHLIVISDKFEEDMDANFICKTIIMLNKNTARVRAVLFTKEDEIHIPKSMANISKIKWYRWHEKGQEHLKTNFDDLLCQFKDRRIQKERQNIKTPKQI